MLHAVVQTVPRREDFLAGLQLHSLDEMQQCIDAFAPLLAGIDEHLASRGLDDPTKAMTGPEIPR